MSEADILNQLRIVAREHTIKVVEGHMEETMPASVVNELRLNNFSAKILLDYITHLQQKEKNNKKALEYLEHIDANYWNLGHKYNVHFDELLEILDKEVN